MPFAVSPYKLQGFGECPKWYYFEYIDETIAPYKKELKQPRSFFTIGDCVHKTINCCLSIEKNQRSEQILLRGLEEIWGFYTGSKGGFKDIEEERDCFGQAELMVRNFWSKQQVMDEPFYCPNNANQEMKRMDLGKDLILQGKIDRVDENENSLHVIDYKTSKMEEENNPFQIFAYALLSENVFKKTVTKASFWYLRSNHLKTFLFNKEEKDKTLQKVLSLVETIKKEKEFEPRRGSRCYICDYVRFCPEKEKVLAMLSKQQNDEIQAEKLPF